MNSKIYAYKVYKSREFVDSITIHADRIELFEGSASFYLNNVLVLDIYNYDHILLVDSNDK